MMWRRFTALLLMVLLPLGGIWLLLACDGQANDSDSDSATGDYCTIICHAQGHYCPVHDKNQEQSCTCNMSGAPPNVAIAGGLVPGVVENPIRLDVTIQWAPAPYAAIETPASVIVESPTPPPKLSV